MSQTGQVIAGKYELVRALARGGMGEVWVARHLQLGSLVALKVMLAQVADKPQLAARFEREAKATAQLKSPHIIQIHDYGIESGAPFMVMELLEGEDLGTRLNRCGRLSLGDVAGIIAQLARGLKTAHAAAVIHRDLKPSNVFMVKSEEIETAKILDFGIAKVDGLSTAVGEQTDTGTILGSPQYMSPEQAKQTKSVDARTDLWSLAMIAYRALTGRLPFEAETFGHLIVSICTEPASSALEHAPDLPPALDGFFARALAKDPDHRFQDATSLAAELRAIASGRPSLAEMRPESNESSAELIAPNPQRGAISASAESSRAVPGEAVTAEGTALDVRRTQAARPRSWLIAAVSLMGLGAAGAWYVFRADRSAGDRHAQADSSARPVPAEGGSAGTVAAPATGRATTAVTSPAIGKSSATPAATRSKPAPAASASVATPTAGQPKPASEITGPWQSSSQPHGGPATPAAKSKVLGF